MPEMTKDELVRHLRNDHRMAIRDPRWTTKPELVQEHRAVHKRLDAMMASLPEVK